MRMAASYAAGFDSRVRARVAPTDGAVVQPGRVAVLLEGAATLISFKLMNLRV